MNLIAHKLLWAVPFVGASILFLLLTNLAPLNFSLHEKPGYTYTGANPYAAADKLVYMSLIEQGRQGVLFMKNLHTTDPQRGSLLSPHWYVIGQTARLLGISNNASYQLYRVLLTIAFLFLLFVVSRLLLPRTDEAFGMSTFVLFSGGLGWLYFMRHLELFGVANTSLKFLRSPTDLYVTEGNTLLNFTQAPLFAASQLLLLLIGYLVVSRRDHPWGWQDAIAVVCTAVLVVIHPYDLPILFAVLGSWIVWQTVTSRSYTALKKFFGIAAAGLAASLYNFYALAADPVLAEWYKQNLVYSPPAHLYLWGYGILLPLAAVGLIDIVKHKRSHPWWVFFGLWSVVVWLLLYTPLNVNRRFINGYHVALAIVAFNGLRYLVSLCRRDWLRYLVSAVVWVFATSSLGFFLVINLYRSPDIYTYGYYYLTPEERHVVNYLAEYTTADDKLLTSDPKTSYTLTAYVSRAVFRGHDHQTPRVLLRQQQLDWFFSDQGTVASVDRKQRFLADEDIAFIVINESRLAQKVAWLETAPFLTEVERAGPLRVLQVLP